MSDDESDDDDHVFFDLLVDRFSPFDDVFATVRKHRTVKQFKLAVCKKLSPLTSIEFDMALDKNAVPWRKFHEDIVRSVADAKGTTKTGAFRGSVMHMNTKVLLKEKFGNCKIDEFDTIDRKDAWRSVLYTFACLYIEELENSVNMDRAIDELSTRIDDILSTTWAPVDDSHAECIYYIVGAMIKAANDKILQPKTTDTLRESLCTLLLLHKTTKDEANEVNAPTRRVEMREAVSLNYSSIELYNIICKYESVFQTLLHEGEIRTYGIGLLKKINTLFSKKDVGMKDLLGEFADDSDAREVSIFFLKYYTNMRGKDYVRKVNAKSNISTETHCATIGVLAYDLARKRNVNDRKRLSQNKPAPPNETTENANDSEGGERENVSDFETMLKEQLKALCKLYKLRISGTKDELLSRLRVFTVSQQNKSEVEESVSGEVDEDTNTDE
jgi:hypothetical protein